MSDLTTFESFQKLHRLKRDCVITEKIDGTNAQIAITEDGQFFVGSRNRYITPADDNYGFAAWAHAHREELMLLGPGRHFGEWWGAGIQRRYGLAEKRFSLFNTGRWGAGGAHEAQRPACCSVVPVVYKGPFSTEAVDDALAGLRKVGSLAAPGFMDPEGVVVYLVASGTSMKVTLDGDGHKGARRGEAA